jgi:putative FmdB family regulatory protein
MLVYTYMCEDCKIEFEAYASIQMKESGWKPACPKCGSNQTQRIFKPLTVIRASRKSSSGKGGCCSSRGG